MTASLKKSIFVMVSLFSVVVHADEQSERAALTKYANKRAVKLDWGTLVTGEERAYFVGETLLVSEGPQQIVKAMDSIKKAGITHIVLDDPQDELTTPVALLKAAKDNGIAIIKNADLIRVLKKNEKARALVFTTDDRAKKSGQPKELAAEGIKGTRSYTIPGGLDKASAVYAATKITSASYLPLPARFNIDYDGIIIFPVPTLDFFPLDADPILTGRANRQSPLILPELRLLDLPPPPSVFLPPPPGFPRIPPTHR